MWKFNCKNYDYFYSVCQDTKFYNQNSEYSQKTFIKSEQYY